MTKQKVTAFCKKNNIEYFHDRFIFTAWAPEGYSFDSCNCMCESWHGGLMKDFWFSVLERMKEEFEKRA